jgi:hypothetical protein
LYYGFSRPEGQMAQDSVRRNKDEMHELSANRTSCCMKLTTFLLGTENEDCGELLEETCDSVNQFSLISLDVAPSATIS